MRLQAAPTQEAVQAIVNRFYPDQLLPSGDADRYATHAVAATAGPDDPSVIIAAYTDRSAGILRVLARNAAGTWEVAADTSETLLLPGGQCQLRLADLDFDGRPEALLYFQAPRAISTWAFRWDAGRLTNLTPTQRGNNGAETSLLLSAFVYDLDHTGPLRIIAERVVERPAPRQRPRNPAYVYRLGPNGFEVEKTVVAAMGFRADVNPEQNVRPFRLIQDSEPPYTLRVINGERGGRNRVNSALIFVNNESVLDQRNINAQAEFASVQLTGLFTENNLSARLNGPGEARIIVLIEDSTQRN
jgi:hypothetical protein